MRKSKYLSVFGLVAILGASACKKDKIDLLDPIPNILNVSVSPGTVVEFRDSIVFEIEYRDGDGDLGENAPDARNLFVRDNRINIVESFRIRELDPSGSEIPITGKLKLVLDHTGITDGSNSQMLSYTVWLRDRAGNESEKIQTEEIEIVK